MIVMSEGLLELHQSNPPVETISGYMDRVVVSKLRGISASIIDPKRLHNGKPLQMDVEAGVSYLETLVYGVNQFALQMESFGGMRSIAYIGGRVNPATSEYAIQQYIYHVLGGHLGSPLDTNIVYDMGKQPILTRVFYGYYEDGDCPVGIHDNNGNKWILGEEHITSFQNHLYVPRYGFIENGERAVRVGFKRHC